MLGEAFNMIKAITNTSVVNLVIFDEMQLLFRRGGVIENMNKNKQNPRRNEREERGQVVVIMDGGRHVGFDGILNDSTVWPRVKGRDLFSATADMHSEHKKTRTATGNTSTGS